MTGETAATLGGSCEWCGSAGFTSLHGRLLCVDCGAVLWRALREARAHCAATEIVGQEETARAQLESDNW